MSFSLLLYTRVKSLSLNLRTLSSRTKPMPLAMVLWTLRTNFMSLFLYLVLRLKSLHTGAAKVEWFKMWLTPRLAFALVCVMAASWEVVTSHNGHGANVETRMLRTRESDGLPECAKDTPWLKTTGSARMANAPAAVACSMACTEHNQCRHFNYDKADPQHPCHLYYKTPQNFEVRSNCRHYYTPGTYISGHACSNIISLVIVKRT